MVEFEKYSSYVTRWQERDNARSGLLELLNRRLVETGGRPISIFEDHSEHYITICMYYEVTPKEE